VADRSKSEVPSARFYKILISIGVVLVGVAMSVGLLLVRMADSPTAGDEAGIIVLPFFAVAALALLGFVLGPTWLWIGDRRRNRRS